MKITKKVRRTRRKNQKMHAQGRKHRSVGQQAIRDKDLIKKRNSCKNTEIAVPYATVVDGNVILVDPVGCAFLQAVAKSNCIATFNMDIQRIAHFKNRIFERGLDPKGYVIVLVYVDDPNGTWIADALMPDFNWQEIRDRSELPYARGIVERTAMKEMIASFDRDAASKLDTILENAVVVVDHGVAEIFSSEVLEVVCA